MDRQKLAVLFILVAAAASMSALAISTQESYTYFPSDITQANPDLVIASGSYYMQHQDIEKTKDTVVLSLSGKVLSVGDIIDWEYKGDKYGAVPVTIKIDNVAKIQKGTAPNVQRGNAFTFYLGGIYEIDQHYIHTFEPQFEIGEDVIVHIGKGNQGPKGPDGDNYFVELGMYGKYRIVGDRAYNENYLTGRSLQDVYAEAKQ